MNPDSRHIRLAVVQFSMSDSRAQNLERACQFVHEAADQGAQIVLLPELFESRYFPRVEDKAFFQLAQPVDRSESVEALRKVAREREVVLPVSFFEKCGNVYYNSVAAVDADGEILGLYRKTHIPNGAGYWERFYFRPGNSGFRVFDTRYGCLGIGICWDQWFVECSRSMALRGADILLYPSAIGSEPEHPDIDTKDPWQRVMIGQAVASSVVIAASNRVGNEGGQQFYGSSFIVDHLGEKRAELGRDAPGITTADFDLDAVRRYRQWFGLLCDRRPEFYQDIVRSRE